MGGGLSDIRLVLVGESSRAKHGHKTFTLWLWKTGLVHNSRSVLMKEDLWAMYSKNMVCAVDRSRRLASFRFTNKKNKNKLCVHWVINNSPYGFMPKCKNRKTKKKCLQDKHLAGVFSCNVNLNKSLVTWMSNDLRTVTRWWCRLGYGFGRGRGSRHFDQDPGNIWWSCRRTCWLDLPAKLTESYSFRQSDRPCC